MAMICSSKAATFNIEPREGGTALTLNYRYMPNLMGRIMRGYTDKQMRKGIGGLAKSLELESERIAS